MTNYLNNPAKIAAPSRIDGRTIYLRLAEVSDAQQLLNWRMNTGFAIGVSLPEKTSLENQITYMHAYKKREAEGSEFYYIICRRDNDTPTGCARIHDIAKHSANWGSWLLDDNKTFSAGVESLLLLYTIAFTFLQLNELSFSVNATEKRVIVLHARIGARQTKHITRGDPPIRETCFLFDRTDYQTAMKKFGNYIPAVTAAITNEENFHE